MRLATESIRLVSGMAYCPARSRVQTPPEAPLGSDRALKSDVPNPLPGLTAKLPSFLRCVPPRTSPDRKTCSSSGQTVFVHRCEKDRNNRYNMLNPPGSMIKSVRDCRGLTLLDRQSAEVRPFPGSDSLLHSFRKPTPSKSRGRNLHPDGYPRPNCRGEPFRPHPDSSSR